MYVVAVTLELLALLRRRRVYLSLDGVDRWAVGSRIAVPEACRIEPFTELLEGRHLPQALGAFSYTHSEVPPWTRIGRYCSLAGGLRWMGADHPMSWASTSPAFHATGHPALAAFREAYGDYGALPWPLPDKTVTIGHDVWIGDEVMIAPGVSIGDGAVIGARSLVLEDVPAYAVAVGHPARVMRYRFAEAVVARFQAARWWRFSPAVVGRLPVSDPERFLDAFEALVARDAPEPMDPLWLTDQDLLAAGQLIRRA